MDETITALARTEAPDKHIQKSNIQKHNVNDVLDFALILVSVFGQWPVCCNIDVAAGERRQELGT